MIGQDRQTKKCIGEFFAAPLHIAKFGRLVQTLAWFERQPLDGQGDRWSVLNPKSRTEAFSALGATAGQQSATALRGHARAKAVGAGTM
jgi:hypothetical protein